jgi:hypothetical protein
MVQDAHGESAASAGRIEYLYLFDAVEHFAGICLVVERIGIVDVRKKTAELLAMFLVVAQQVKKCSMSDSVTM